MPTKTIFIFIFIFMLFGFSEKSKSEIQEVIQVKTESRFALLSKHERGEFIEAIKNGDCTYKGITLFGKVKFVESFPDIKIQFVGSFPDLKVKMVSSLMASSLFMERRLFFLKFTGPNSTSDGEKNNPNRGLVI